MDTNLLIWKAKEAALNSYSPYSNFRVGASVLTKEGSIFCGTNVENGSFGGTICAERVALSTAVTNGFKEFEAICVVGLDFDDYLLPCGICLQFISEFNEDIKIVLVNKKEEYLIKTLSDLLPLKFNLNGKFPCLKET